MKAIPIVPIIEIVESEVIPSIQIEIEGDILKAVIVSVADLRR